MCIDACRSLFSCWEQPVLEDIPRHHVSHCCDCCDNDVLTLKMVIQETSGCEYYPSDGEMDGYERKSYSGCSGEEP